MWGSWTTGEKNSFWNLASCWNTSSLTSIKGFGKNYLVMVEFWWWEIWFLQSEGYVVMWFNKLLGHGIWTSAKTKTAGEWMMNVFFFFFFLWGVTVALWEIANSLQQKYQSAFIVFAHIFKGVRFLSEIKLPNDLSWKKFVSFWVT